METFLKLIKIYGRFFVISLATVLGLTIYPEVGFSASDPSLQLSNTLAKPSVSNATVSGSSDAVGSLTGSFSVTPTGQAHYAIAIDVPPGTAKMQPAFSFTYDSSSSNTRNGLLGMGFSLEGLTAISRCSSNKIQNGIIHGVDYSDNDRFCLNGDQLVAVKGAYGQDGTEYRTYNDTQARIISHGRQGNGPAYFTVDAKGGISAQYGMTAESQVKAQGKDSVAMWAVNRIKDTNSNYMDVHYYKDESIGNFYPTEVDYTGNEKTGMQPYNSMKMSYSSRSDVVTGWSAGSKTTIDKFLSKVQTYQRTTLVSEYRLSYAKSSNTGRNRLLSIQKCDGAGLCLPATKFNWQTNEEGWVEAPQFLSPAIIVTSVDNNDLGVQMEDLNGDGLVDIAQAQAGGTIKSWLNTGNGWQESTPYKLPTIIVSSNSLDEGTRFEDLNGDGLIDLIRSYQGGTAPQDNKSWLNTGSGWQEAAPYLSPAAIVSNDRKDEGTRFEDVNGDGLIDMLMGQNYSSTPDYHKTWLNTGAPMSGSIWKDASTYTPPINYAPPTTIVVWPGGIDEGVRFVDVNGDGLVDTIRAHDTPQDQKTWLNTGNGWQESAQYLLPVMIVTSDNRDEGTRFQDINGDGLIDVVQSIVYQTPTAWLNTGNGWIKSPQFMPPFTIVSGALQDDGSRFIDFNGDGLPDVVRYLTGECTNPVIDHKSWLNTGSGWIEYSKYLLPEGAAITSTRDHDVRKDEGERFVDLNGDGFTDIIKNLGGSLKGAWLNKAQKLPDYLISVTDGLGSTLNIDYAAISDAKYAAKLYTKEHNATYPNQDYQGAMYVVTQTTSDAKINDTAAVQRLLAAANAAGTSPESALSHITNYHYTGAKFNLLGAGFLGFHQVMITDNSTGISKTTTYSQDPNQHNVGAELASETHLANGTLVASTQNSWVTVPTGDGKTNGTYYRYYTHQVIDKSFALNGTAMSTKTTTIDVDTYNNPTKTVASIQDSTGTYTTTTTNTYQNDNTKWFIGLLTGTTVMAAAPNQSSITRTSSFSNDPNTGMLLQTMVEPSDSTFKLTTTYVRDAFGNITKTTVSGQGISDVVSSAIYDDQGRFPVKQTDPLGHVTSQAYDARFGVPTQSTDANGLITTYNYDTFGKLIQTIAPTSTTNVVYSWASDPNAPGAVYMTSTSTVGGSFSNVYYDALNRPIAESVPKMDAESGLVWRTTQYDELGRVTHKAMPYFKVTPTSNVSIYYVNYQYDVLGRVITITYPNNKTTTVTYDGYTTTTTNILGQKQIKMVNARGDLIKSTDNLGNFITYTYDIFSKLTQLQDSVGNVTLITYDKYGHKLTIKDPDKGSWIFTYDVLGQLLSQTDSLQHTTTFQYDKLGRMISRTDPAGTSTWQYDTAPNGVGKLAGVNGVAGAKGGAAAGDELIKAARDGLVNHQSSYGYDTLSRPSYTKTTINGVLYASAVSYDQYSRIATKVYPSGMAIKNEYNDYGTLKRITNQKTGQLYWQLNSANASGQVTSETLSNGLINSYTYDAKTAVLTDIIAAPGQALQTQKHLFPSATTTTVKHKQMSQATASGSASNVTNATNDVSAASPSSVVSGSPVQQIHYSFDQIGNVTARNDSVNNINETFKYDELNRVTEATNNGVATTYKYDVLGNITYNPDLGTYIYDQSGNLPHAVQAISGKVKALYQYDGNGNQTSGVFNGVTRTITYTSYSKPLAITSQDVSTNFYYNADRDMFERVDKNKDKTITTLYLGDYEVTMEDSGGKITTQQKHYIGPHTIYIKNSDASENTYETLKDALGSVTDITDSSGNVLQHFYYAPFGKQTQTKGAVLDNPITNQGFSGHEEIAAFNLVHMGGRLYDPVIGRFLSADPTLQMPDNLQNLNRYSYCMNNPLHFIDYNGFGMFDWIGDIVDDVCSFVGDVVDDVCGFVGDLAKSMFSVQGMENLIQLAAGTFCPIALPFVAAAIVAVNGGNFGDMLKSAAMAYFTQKAWNITGDYLQDVENSTTLTSTAKNLTKIASHGCVGGALSMIEGGNFQDGFISCAAGAAVQCAFQPLGLDGASQTDIMERTAICGVVGGVAASITGGDFVQGFQNAAFAQLFNDERHIQLGTFSKDSEVQKQFMKDNYDRLYDPNYRAALLGMSVATALTFVPGGDVLIEIAVEETLGETAASIAVTGYKTYEAMQLPCEGMEFAGNINGAGNPSQEDWARLNALSYAYK